MRHSKSSFTTGLLIGVIAGLVAGTVTVAHSTTGKKAWDRFGHMFQAGYIAGFQDCVRIAKAMDKDSYVARSFTLPATAKPTNFQAWIEMAYADPKYVEKTIPQLLVVAGYKLESKYGPEIPTGDFGMETLGRVLQARREVQMEAEQAARDLAAEKAADAAKAPTGAADPAPADPTPAAE